MTTTHTSINTATIEQLSLLFAAMADPSRATILVLLLGGEKRSGELAAALAVTHSAVSHQLRWLRERELITARKIGREVFYALADDCVREIMEVALRHIQEGKQ